MRRKTKLKDKLIAARNAHARTKLLEELSKIEQDLLESHDREAQLEEEKAVQAIKINSKFFFNYARQKSNTKERIGPLEEGGKMVVEDKQKAEVFSKQFESVFTTPKFCKSDIENFCDGVGVHTRMSKLEFNKEDIKESIRELKNSSAPGPDGIPVIFLKNCMEEIAEPIKILWVKSLASGVIPSKLKTGLIVPIFKNGGRQTAKNYRPVSLTSHLVKIFERVIVRKMVEYLETNDLYNKRQHGFRRGRSCLSQLIEQHAEILDSMCNGHAVDVVYLDFAKAFDKVDHGLLLKKLANIGVGRELLTWIKNFLTNRKQTVEVNGRLSDEADVRSGVPQGTVLGPLLFLIFVSDIDKDVNRSKLSSFADDTRILKIIKKPEDCQELQEDLEKVCSWVDENNMSLNENKFEALRCGKHPAVDVEYRTGGSIPIPFKDNVKDLGILVQKDAKFDLNIGEVCKKSRRQAGWILRTFKTREPLAMLTLYRALVLPIAEYCCQLWSPAAIGMIKEIEGIQRTFTSRIRGMEHLNYWDRLKALSLYSLQRRRERYTIIYVWKIIQGLAPNFEREDLKIKTYGVGTRLGRRCVLPPLIRSGEGSIRDRSFITFGPRLFNCLPCDIRQFEGSLMTFKRKVDKFLADVEDKPPLPGYVNAAAGNNIVQQTAHARALNL